MLFASPLLGFLSLSLSVSRFTLAELPREDRFRVAPPRFIARGHDGGRNPPGFPTGPLFPDADTFSHELGLDSPHDSKPNPPKANPPKEPQSPHPPSTNDPGHGSQDNGHDRGNGNGNGGSHRPGAPAPPSHPAPKPPPSKPAPKPPANPAPKPPSNPAPKPPNPAPNPPSNPAPKPPSSPPSKPPPKPPSSPPSSPPGGKGPQDPNDHHPGSGNGGGKHGHHTHTHKHHDPHDPTKTPPTPGISTITIPGVPTITIPDIPHPPPKTTTPEPTITSQKPPTSTPETTTTTAKVTEPPTHNSPGKSPPHPTNDTTTPQDPTTTDPAIPPITVPPIGSNNTTPVDIPDPTTTTKTSQTDKAEPTTTPPSEITTTTTNPPPVPTITFNPPGPTTTTTVPAPPSTDTSTPVAPPPTVTTTIASGTSGNSSPINSSGIASITSGITTISGTGSGIGSGIPTNMSTVFQPPTTPVAIPTQLSGVLTDTSSLEVNTMPKSLPTSGTLSDPDQATTTFSQPSSGAPIATPTLPSTLPHVILANPAPDLSTLRGTTMISLLFDLHLGYVWMYAHQQLQAQVFTYMPSLLGQALNISSAQVKSYMMQAYTPPGSNGSLPSILTLYNAYIPSEKVDELRLQLSATNSLYFKGSSGVAGELANFTVPSFPPVFAPDPNSKSSGSGGGSSGGNSSDARLKAVIGVCSGVAGIILIILAIWRYRASRNRSQERAAARQRVFASRRRGYGTLDDGDDDGQEIMYERDPSSVLDISPDPIRRRESFYHAADALREHQREVRRSQAYQLPPNYRAIIAAHTTDGARGQREMTDYNQAPIYNMYRGGVHFDSSPERSS